MNGFCARLLWPEGKERSRTTSKRQKHKQGRFGRQGTDNASLGGGTKAQEATVRGCCGGKVNLNHKIYLSRD